MADLLGKAIPVVDCRAMFLELSSSMAALRDVSQHILKKVIPQDILGSSTILQQAM